MNQHDDTEPDGSSPSAGPFSHLPIAKRVFILLLLTAIIVLINYFQSRASDVWRSNGTEILGDWRALFAFGLVGLEAYFAYFLSLPILLADISPREQRIANWIIFITIAIGTIILEILAIIGSWPVSILFGVLIFLASFLVLYGTAFWIWTPEFLYARRQLCEVWVPVYWRVYKRSMIEVLACFEWGVNESVECLRWGQRTTRQCRQYQRVRITGLITLIKAAIDKLVEWVCVAWTFVREFFCVIWVVIRALFCLVWRVIVFIFWTLVGIGILLLRLLFWC